ncbi:type 1 glutamine amidotransferase [Candidatus Bathyarchaeota archaeon]|nr:type 1 glutamine amidotransferase [Candidatus Bathyarchaeota archaeon]MBS7613320.1 type 1 glutamine amidotransferase [Candidatus Bathyarchaeota archaeon]MBS7617027.1 type 1 glutamine amidotransferase [Candidatus Bathyarchaeota archaeon]
MPKYVKRTGPKCRLENRRVAIIVAHEFEDVELLYPFLRLSEEGAEVVIVPLEAGLHPRPSIKGKPVTGRYGTPIPLEVFEEGGRYAIRNMGQIDLEDLDAIIIPGGFSPDALRITPEVLELVRKAYERGKIIAAICHGPQVLISAGLVNGRRVTSYVAVKDDLINAGAVFVDEPSVRDGNIITARVPDDLPEFCQMIIESLT